MEYGIKIKDINELEKRDLSKYQYIYFGNEFCEKKLPRREEIKTLFEFCKSNKKTPVILTPPLTDKGIKNLKRKISEIPEIPLEIVINDFGLLNIDELKKENIRLNLGRLMIKAKKGPEIMAGCLNEPPKNFRDTSLSSENFRDFFRNYVKRFEIDIMPQGINLPENEKISLYVGNCVISVTRKCPYPDSDRPEEEYGYKIKDCKKECMKYYSLKNTKYYSEPIFVMGNAELQKTKMKVPHEFKERIDRVVIFPKIQDCL